MLYFHRLCNFRLQRYDFFLTYAREKAIFCVFSSLSHLSLFSALRSSMFALRTRAAHLLLDCPPDTLRCALTASRSSLGQGVEKTGGYKHGQETHKTTQNGQKVIRSVIYINLTCPYINFCFAIMLYFSNLRIVNINRKIWI